MQAEQAPGILDKDIDPGGGWPQRGFPYPGLSDIAQPGVRKSTAESTYAANWQAARIIELRESRNAPTIAVSSFRLHRAFKQTGVIFLTSLARIGLVAMVCKRALDDFRKHVCRDFQLCQPGG